METQNVADYLIKEGYLLTALELHVELSEKGKPLSSLSSYFKDPKNFLQDDFTRSYSYSPQSSVSGLESSLFDFTRNSFIFDKVHLFGGGGAITGIEDYCKLVKYIFI